MKRRTPGLRISGLVLLVLVVAQPQVLCGLHCMFFARSVPMGAPSGHPAHPDHGTLCHGRAFTGGRTIPAGRLATAWLPSDPSLTVPVSLHAFPLLDPAPPGPSVCLDPERPPPRG